MNGLEALLERPHLDITNAAQRQVQLVLSPNKLEIIKHSDPHESFTLQVLEDRAVVVYYGKNGRTMQQTIKKLKIPNSYPNNAGEKLFYIFRSMLISSEMCTELALRRDFQLSEVKQFSLILDKLLHVYSGREIDSYFYESRSARH